MSSAQGVLFCRPVIPSALDRFSLHQQTRLPSWAGFTILMSLLPLVADLGSKSYVWGKNALLALCVSCTAIHLNHLVQSTCPSKTLIYSAPEHVASFIHVVFLSYMNQFLSLYMTMKWQKQIIFIPLFKWINIMGLHIFLKVSKYSSWTNQELNQ